MGRHRLSVRTSGSHPGKRGSIPRGDTNNKKSPTPVGDFLFCTTGIEQEGGRGNICFSVWGDRSETEG